MAPAIPTQAAPSKPQLLRFIMALFIAKSKSANTSVQDYLTQLRLWITQGRRPNTSTDSHGHVDTSGFWRDAHKKSEETVMELRAKVFELERRCERQNPQISSRSTAAAPQRKRNSLLADLGESPHSRTSKHARTTTSTLVTEAEDGLLPVSLDELKNLSLNRHTTTLLQHIYLLQQIRSRQNPAAQEYATILSQISIDISCMVSTVARSTVVGDPDNANTRNSTTRAQERTVIKTQAAIDFEFDSKLLATGRVVRWLLNSIHVVDQTPAGKDLQSHVVYSYVTLFRRLLEQICDLAASHSKNNETRNRKNNWPRTTIQGLKASQPSGTTDKTTTKLCGLLVNMATSLNPSNPTHQAIQDGFFFFLLTRVGQLLTHFVFNKDDDPETTPAATKTTADPLPRANPTASTKPRAETEMSARASQAPYLIYILSHMAPLTTCPSPFLLAEKARLKLQHTLLQSVFGKQTGEFVDALTEPAFPDPLGNADAGGDAEVAGREERGMGDWYKQEVWRIVGWDVLAQHIEWGQSAVA